MCFGRTLEHARPPIFLNTSSAELLRVFGVWTSCGVLEPSQLNDGSEPTMDPTPLRLPDIIHVMNEIRPSQFSLLFHFRVLSRKSRPVNEATTSPHSYLPHPSSHAPHPSSHAPHPSSYPHLYSLYTCTSTHTYSLHIHTYIHTSILITVTATDMLP